MTSILQDSASLDSISQMQQSPIWNNLGNNNLETTSAPDPEHFMTGNNATIEIVTN